MKLEFVKYKNRKIYCKGLAKYYSLDDIQREVVAGNSVNITCKKTGFNITSLVLGKVFRRMLRNVPSHAVEDMIRGVAS